MSESVPSGLLKTSFGILKDAAGYVGVALTFIAALREVGPEPYPVLAGSLSFLIVSLLVWVARWPGLTRYETPPASLLQVVGTLKKEKPPTGINLLLDPFRAKSSRQYSLPLVRRRVELLALISLVTFSSAWLVSRYCTIQDELRGIDCIDPNRCHPFQVVIANFDDLSSPAEKFDDLLARAMWEHMKADVKICRLKKIVGFEQVADLSAKSRATIFITGIADQTGFNVYIDATGYAALGKSLQAVPADMATLKFQQQELQHVPFLADLLFSEILFMDYREAEGLENLLAALKNAEDSGLRAEYPRQLAEGYFFAALLLDPEEEGIDPDEQAALQAYTDAIETYPQLYAARLNRGFLYSEYFDNPQSAIEDYSYIIDHQAEIREKDFLASAYASRAFLYAGQADTRRQAEADFAVVITLAPEAGYRDRGRVRYHLWRDYPGTILDMTALIELLENDSDPQTRPDVFDFNTLGKAYLLSGEFELGRQAYQDATEYLQSEEERGFLLGDLDTLADDNPALKPHIEEIKTLLNAARLIE